ncbi:MAG: hypothetical protein LBJ32_03720, partial [Oscillospiraceae bacterium]|nr:hypothetical protein [Oscillospiraceae bacterium]
RKLANENASALEALVNENASALEALNGRSLELAIRGATCFFMSALTGGTIFFTKRSPKFKAVPKPLIALAIGLSSAAIASLMVYGSCENEMQALKEEQALKEQALKEEASKEEQTSEEKQALIEQKVRLEQRIQGNAEIFAKICDLFIFKPNDIMCYNLLITEVSSNEFGIKTNADFIYSKFFPLPRRSYKKKMENFVQIFQSAKRTNIVEDYDLLMEYADNSRIIPFQLRFDQMAVAIRKVINFFISIGLSWNEIENIVTKYFFRPNYYSNGIGGIEKFRKVAGPERSEMIRFSTFLEMIPSDKPNLFRLTLDPWNPNVNSIFGIAKHVKIFKKAGLSENRIKHLMALCFPEGDTKTIRQETESERSETIPLQVHINQSEITTEKDYLKEKKILESRIAALAPTEKNKKIPFKFRTDEAALAYKILVEEGIPEDSIRVSMLRTFPGINIDSFFEECRGTKDISLVHRNAIGEKIDITDLTEGKETSEN